VAEPIADAVPQHRAADRDPRDGPRIEDLQADEHAAGECDRASRDDRADQRDRLEKRRREHGNQRNRRVLGEIADQRLQV
jgi:hypothetical protein